MHDPTRTIANRYLLESILGEGAHAKTYLATDLALKRKVAVKILRPEYASSEGDIVRFKHEARTAASVSHPNIVPIFDVGSWSGQTYLVMEWVNGSTLKELIRSRRRLDVDSALRIADELLAGVEAIHAAGIIHRDIKPQNVLVTPEGTVKLTDFGVAHSAQDPPNNTTGQTMGTAAYMSPEQAQGLDATPAVDIYAAGVILYEMLTGRLPFAGDDPLHVIDQHLREPVVRPRRLNPRIPGQIERIVLQALAKDPADRFYSGNEMRRVLDEARAGPQPVEPPSLPASSLGSGMFGTFPQRSRMAWVTATAVLMLSMLLGSTVIAMRDFTPIAIEPDSDSAVTTPDQGNSTAQGYSTPYRATGGFESQQSIDTGEDEDFIHPEPSPTEEQESAPVSIPAPTVDPGQEPVPTPTATPEPIPTVVPQDAAQEIVNSSESEPPPAPEAPAPTPTPEAQGDEGDDERANDEVYEEARDEEDDAGNDDARDEDVDPGDDEEAQEEGDPSAEEASEEDDARIDEHEEDEETIQEDSEDSASPDDGGSEAGDEHAESADPESEGQEEPEGSSESESDDGLNGEDADAETADDPEASEDEIAESSVVANDDEATDDEDEERNSDGHGVEDEATDDSPDAVPEDESEQDAVEGEADHEDHEEHENEDSEDSLHSDEAEHHDDADDDDV